MWFRCLTQKLHYTCWIISFQESNILWLRIRVPWSLRGVWRLFVIWRCRFLQLTAVVIYFNRNPITARSGHITIAVSTSCPTQHSSRLFPIPGVLCHLMAVTVTAKLCLAFQKCQLLNRNSPHTHTKKFHLWPCSEDWLNVVPLPT